MSVPYKLTLHAKSFFPQMGSKFKKALIAESVRDSLHNWCKRVKERSKTLRLLATRSTCSLGSTIEEGDEEITVASVTLSQSSSTGTLNHMDDDNQDSFGIHFTIEEGDEEITVASGTLSQSSSTGTLNHMDDDNQDSGPLPQQECLNTCQIP
nr:MLO-like protein 4 isoform X1 [Tanacetum cinerariifolium]